MDSRNPYFNYGVWTLDLFISGMTMSSGRGIQTCSSTEELYACAEARVFHISIYTLKS
jgi:hypothetical protein